MKTVCAWCKKLISDAPNTEEITHTICEKCADKFNRQADELSRKESE